LNNFKEYDEGLSGINEKTLLNICSMYLEEFDEDFIFLVLKARRTKEIAILMDVPACEVVRRRRVLARKIRAVYTYHFKLNYVEFLRFAERHIEPEKMKCLVLHYVELKSLKNIAAEFKIQPSTVQRWLQGAKSELSSAMENKEQLKVFLNCFDDLPYLNIKQIKRSPKDIKKLNSTQIGSATLGQWISKKIELGKYGAVKFVDQAKVFA
jgi:hypothetical protein